MSELERVCPWCGSELGPIDGFTRCGGCDNPVREGEEEYVDPEAELQVLDDEGL